MAAMQLYDPDELKSKLKNLGCAQTLQRTKTSTAWVAANGKTFLVPDPPKASGRYSDFEYDHIIDMATRISAS